MQHLLYGMEFAHGEQVLDKVSTFVPIGWDSKEKIEADVSNQNLSDDLSLPLENAVPNIKEDERSESTNLIVTEDDDQFLQRMYLKSHDEEYTKSIFGKVATAMRTNTLGNETEAPKEQNNDFKAFLQERRNDTESKEASL